MKKTAKKTVTIGEIIGPKLTKQISDFVDGFVSQNGPAKINAFLKAMPEFMRRSRDLAREIKSKAGGDEKALDYLIQRFLEDYHKNRITMPDINATHETMLPGNRLVVDFIEAVARNDKNYIRQIADGISRVHLRAKGYGDSFVITPADKARAQVFSHFEKNGPPQSLAQTRAAMLAAGIIDANLDPKTIQRWHKDLDGAAGKRGRPSKTKVAPKLKKPAVVSLKEIRARATAASAKLPRLLEKKPTVKIRTKGRETPS